MNKYPQYLYPSSLLPHPDLLEQLPDQTTLEWRDLYEDIEDNGITEPIYFVDGEENNWYIVDGIRRWIIAKEIRIKDMAAIRLTAEEGATFLKEKARSQES